VITAGIQQAHGDVGTVTRGPDAILFIEEKAPIFNLQGLVFGVWQNLIKSNHGPTMLYLINGKMRIEFFVRDLIRYLSFVGIKQIGQ
jgi:hypothetical protein